MTTVKILDTELRVNQSLEYRGTFNGKISMGKIVELRQVDEDSVWMLVSDMEDARSRYWLSVNAYGEEFLIKKEETTNDNTEPDNTEEYPF